MARAKRDLEQESKQEAEVAELEKEHDALLETIERQEMEKEEQKVLEEKEEKRRKVEEEDEERVSGERIRVVDSAWTRLHVFF